MYVPESTRTSAHAACSASATPGTPGRVQARGGRGKVAVRRERVHDARAGQDEAVRAPERGHEDRRRHPRAAARHERRGGRRSDAILRGVSDSGRGRACAGIRRSRARRARRRARSRGGARAGTCGPGSTTSAPGNVTFVQADCENAGPTSARANATTRAPSPAASARPARAGASGAGASEQDPARRESRERGDLDGGERVLDARPHLQPERVRAREDEHDERRDGLRRAAPRTGTRRPRNFENATATAAIVPVWMTSTVVQP